VSGQSDCGDNYSVKCSLQFLSCYEDSVQILRNRNMDDMWGGGRGVVI